MDDTSTASGPIPFGLPRRVPRLVPRDLTAAERAFVRHRRQVVVNVWIGFVALAFSFGVLMWSEGLDLSYGSFIALLIVQALCVVLGGLGVLVVTLNSRTWRAGREVYVERRSGSLAARGRPTVAGQPVFFPPGWARRLTPGEDVTVEIVPARADQFWWTAPALVVRVPSHGLTLGEVNTAGKEMVAGAAVPLDRPLTQAEWAGIRRASGPSGSADDRDGGHLYRVSGPVTVRRSPFSAWIGEVPVEVSPAWKGDLAPGQPAEGEVYLPASGQVPLLLRLGPRSLDAEGDGARAGEWRRPKPRAKAPLTLIVAVGLTAACAAPILGQVRQQGERQAYWDYQDALTRLNDQFYALAPALCARSDTRKSPWGSSDVTYVDGYLSDAGQTAAQQALAAMKRDLNGLRLPPGGFANYVSSEAQTLRSNIDEEQELVGSRGMVSCK